jgi:hypothetical protein
MPDQTPTGDPQLAHMLSPQAFGIFVENLLTTCELQTRNG